MPNIDDLIPNRILKASDLLMRDGNYANNVRVVIEDLKMEAVGRDRKLQPVLYFKGKDKQMVLNATNIKAIAEATGEKDTENWVNKPIFLFVTTADFGGETFDVIRIRKQAPTAAARATEPAEAVTKPVTPRETFVSEPTEPAEGNGTAPAPTATAPQPAEVPF